MEDLPFTIATSAAPAPFGHYVQAKAWRDLIFVSGQLAPKADGTHDPKAPFEVQVRRSLQHILSVLEAAVSDANHLLRVTAYVVGVENWPLFNRVYADVLGGARPARSVVPVSELHHGYLIEVEAIAVRANDGSAIPEKPEEPRA
jgi:2-iminobutanoate/2-iminopropanoate deaminase